MHRLVLLGPRGLRLRCRVAVSNRERRRGLIGHPALTAGEALLLPTASSVHTFGMQTPILVARLDGALRVVDLRRVPPRRLLWPILGARHVLESPEGTDLRVGDRLLEERVTETAAAQLG